MPVAMTAKITDANLQGDDYAMAVCIKAGVEPKNGAEARTSPDWPHWEEAMHREIAELQGKGTWEVVSRPQGANIVGSRWTYHLKHDTNGTIVRYKARLVAQGFTQSFGVDYDETYAPVAKFVSTCVILALAALNNWEVEQVDVKNVYLNAELTETIYMAQPPGFALPGRKNHVC